MIIINKKSERRKGKEIRKLIKMIMKAIILMISWHYKTIKMRNNSKTACRKIKTKNKKQKNK